LNETLVQEKEYLKRVYKQLQLQIVHYIEENTRTSGDMKAVLEQVWEELDSGYEEQELQQNIDMLGQMASMQRWGDRQLRTYMHMREQAYFGRIDFRDLSGNLSQVYVGRSALADDNMNFMVCDWRAPISGLFYQGHMGRVQYEAPGGTITGDLERRRQYIIDNDKLEAMFESDIKIDDEVLMNMLSKGAGGHLRSMVSTIQAEQNKAIRAQGSRVLLVDGPAGCGKTSIAMHRAAWLLYQSGREIKSEELVSIGQSELFSSYLSTVLPELDEENITFTTRDALIKVNVPGWRVQSSFDHMEMMLVLKNTVHGRELAAQTTLKNSKAFFEALEEFCRYYEAREDLLGDLFFDGKLYMSRQELMHVAEGGYLTFAQRMNRARNAAISRMLEYKKKWQNAKILELKLKGMSNGEARSSAAKQAKFAMKAAGAQIGIMFHRNGMELYDMFASQLERFMPDVDARHARALREKLKTAHYQRYLEYDDAQVAMYLQVRLCGARTPWRTRTRHVIVDEVQDYTPLQMAALGIICPSTAMTLLGDERQRMPGTELTMLDIPKLIGADDYQRISLLHSYRSTLQINRFASRMLDRDDHIIPVVREGEAPRVLVAADDEQQRQIIDRWLAEVSKKYATSAIITRSNHTASKIAQQLGLTLLTPEFSGEMGGKTVVVPACLSKGLEFDAVLVLTPQDDMFAGPAERQLFYVVCTRALHELTVVSCAPDMPEWLMNPETSQNT